MMRRLYKLVLSVFVGLFIGYGCHRALTEPSPLPDPTPIPEPINPHSYGRVIWSGPFFATDPTRYGIADTPGNVEVVADGSDASQRVNKLRKVIASPDDLLGTGHLSMDTVADQDLLAIFFGIGGTCSIADTQTETVHKLLPGARVKASALNIPILFYCDDSNHYNPDMLVSLVQPGDWIGINAYPRDRNDTPADIIARVQSTLANTDWPAIAIIRPMYDGGTRLWPMTLINDLQVPLTDLIRSDNRIVADLWFSWLRPSGVVTHPELAIVAKQLDQAARTGQ